jgi:transcriptional regulator with XRE-family HTH domain
MRLGEILRYWRKFADRTVREAAADIGISPATLCRVENGKEMDGKTLAKILNWLTAPALIVRKSLSRGPDGAAQQRGGCSSPATNTHPQATRSKC